MAAGSERNMQHPASDGENPEVETVDGEPLQETLGGETAAPEETAAEKKSQQQLMRERFVLLGGLLVVVAAIFAVTALDAPWYMVYDRGPDDTIDSLDSHIGAPSRVFGISILWYFATAAAVGGIALLGKSRRL
ncbi:MAG: hypothetical protein CMJ81_16005 [Planctomycetaceae bacterium]|jgi:hypothetical protein|nr:hypothetical protein [Planctomycetaceae bacterium]